MEMISVPTATPDGLLEGGYGHLPFISESQKIALVLTHTFQDPQTDKGYFYLQPRLWIPYRIPDLSPMVSKNYYMQLE